MDSSESIYLQAYNELVMYLRALFIYYNSKISDVEIENIQDKWEWSKVIRDLYESNKVEKIYIITYNYDIMLERVLSKMNIKYQVYNNTYDGSTKIQIYKPHGSIGFEHNDILPDEAYEIKNAFENTDAEITSFKVKICDHASNPRVIPLIPPAGQASRYKNNWATQIRNAIQSQCKLSTGSDFLLFGGLSYWHVDREEIDEIILELDSSIEMCLVNPNPPEEFTAVLTTIFKNSTIVPAAADTLNPDFSYPLVQG